MSVALDMRAAEELRQLRQDNMALRQELERTQSDRDAWRLRCEQMAYAHAQFVSKVRALVREPS